MSREMKETGISYLGLIPDKWQKRRVKTLSTCLDGKRIPVDATLRVAGPYPYWGAGSIVDYVNDYIFDDTLVLVGEDGAPFFDDTRSVSILSKGKIWVNNHIHVLKNNEAVMAEYLAYALRVVDYSDYLTGSVFPKLTQGNMNEIYLAIPPILEQQAIVRYLDSKCSAIDEAIERHKKIIEKLEEYRKASAFNAVTKGIAGAPLKASGEEWLGNIPENWSVQRNWTLFKEVNERGNESLPILTVSINTGISDRELSDDESERVFVRSADRSKYKRVQPGDIAYNMMRAWQGAFGTARVEGMVSPAYVTVRPVTEMDSRYYEYLMRSDSAAQEFEKYSRGITDFRFRLYYPEFSNIKVCVPPLSEQKEIADYLDDLYKKTDMAIKRITTIINKLEAYRKSIIYHAVTGKIDCRNS